MTRFRRLYGAHPLHLLTLIAALALTTYTIWVLGVDALINPRVWWQSIVVWFAVAIIAHDLVLFPLYALADRILTRRRPHHQHTTGRPPLTNYLRLPTLASGLLLLMFLPGIIEQGAPAYQTATGLTQDPFLARWLTITATLYTISAVWYLTKYAEQHRRSTSRDG